MIGPEEIIYRLRKWWPEVLAAAVRGEELFPREVPRIGRVKASVRLEDFLTIREQQQRLMAGTKEQLGAGFMLEWREVNTRKMGRNRFVHAIHIPTLKDYLFLLNQEHTYRKFLADVTLIRALRLRSAEPRAQVMTPQQGRVLGEDWIAKHSQRIVAHSGVWPGLLAVVDYFVNDHQADRYYVRELPVAVPTKFIETHKPILTALLEAALPPESLRPANKKKYAFEQRFGLKWPQPLVRLRVLDQALADSHLAGLNDLSLPRDVFNRLALPLRRVILLENKTSYDGLLNFLTLPQCSGTVAVFAAGFKVGALKEARWLHDVELLYWGDLDAHGLQIVNQARGYFPHLCTLLMDRATLDALTEYHVEGPLANANDLPHLTAEELALYDHLNKGRIRLEQERVPLAMVRKALAG